MRIMTMKVLLLLFCLLSTSQSQSIYRCDFEEPCEDFVFDSYWIVENVSSHIDHTYGNLSGHYITYINTSVSTPLTTFRARDWVETTSNLTACLSQWIYSGPGEVYFEMELAQGDDLQARLPVGRIGMNVPDPQWRGGSIEFPYATHFVPFVLYTNITSVLDLDDISVSLCPRTNPIPPTRTVLDCDFDKTLCPELISWSNYSYSWSMIQAGKAQNYTKTAPAVDYSIGDETGHYIWLNNSNSLLPGGAGYLSTPVFRFTVADPAFCLSFHYYRFGLMFKTSKLTVLALAEGNAKSVEQVWPINPINYTYVNERWSWAYAPLPVGNYSLLFRMDSEYEVNSSFAVDSISVKSCGYQQLYFLSTSRLELDCDFDPTKDPTCGIQNDYTDLNPQSVIDYTMQTPNNINDRELGPRQTTGWSGDWFLYWSRSERTSQNLTTGQFKVPMIETNRDMCIRFAYFVNSTGVQLNENNTKIQVATRGCHETTLWSVELDSSVGWQLITMPLDHIACTQTVYFRITQQRPTRVAVAFDNIAITQCGTFNVLTTTTGSPTTTPFNKSSSNYFSLFNIVALFVSNMYFWYNI